MGEKDSHDHARGEGSLTYTNGNCFKVKNSTIIVTGRKLVVAGEV